MLVWSMCDWSGFYNTGMCEYWFGQCASGPIFTTPKCASGRPTSLVNVRVLVCATPGWASASLVNVRLVRFLQHRNVRVIVWSVCEC